MTLDERKSESILLKERWCLIQSGVDKKDIKIHKSLLYIKQHTVKNIGGHVPPKSCGG